MTKNQEKSNPFIEFLLSKKDDRGVLAALRRGLGQAPGQSPDMYPYVIHFLPEKPYPTLESAYYLTASLFAFHPLNTSAGNLGDHMTATIRSEGERQSVERRFTNLLKAHVDDLRVYLRQSIGILKSREIPVNWNQLLNDLIYWDHPQLFVQQKWAKSFWGRKYPSNELIESEKEKT